MGLDDSTGVGIGRESQDLRRHRACRCGYDYFAVSNEIESIDTRRRADNYAPHRHRLEDLDVGARGCGERRQHKFCAVIAVPDIGDKSFEFDAGLRQIRKIQSHARAVEIEKVFGCSSCDDVQCEARPEQGPYFAEEEVECEEIGQVRERSDEEQTARLGLDG